VPTTFTSVTTPDSNSSVISETRGEDNKTTTQQFTVDPSGNAKPVESGIGTEVIVGIGLGVLGSALCCVGAVAYAKRRRDHDRARATGDSSPEGRDDVEIPHSADRRDLREDFTHGAANSIISSECYDTSKDDPRFDLGLACEKIPGRELRLHTAEHLESGCVQEDASRV
jgi:hypothetical protein